MVNKEQNKEYKQKNKEKIKEQNKEYYQKNKQKLKEYKQKNKEKIKEQNKKYKQKNKQKLKEYNKKWYQKNKEQNKEYYQKNKEQKKEYSTEYYKKNKEKIKAQNKKYKQKRYQNDVNYRIRSIIRSRIHGAIKSHSVIKSNRTIELLGCSIRDVRQHLENQFKDGMSWKNHGEWHIDHIKPCASFNMKDPEQQKECFNYKNLQPLWAEENMSKGAKIIE